jgi:hypothetical protein
VKIKLGGHNHSLSSEHSPKRFHLDKPEREISPPRFPAELTGRSKNLLAPNKCRKTTENHDVLHTSIPSFIKPVLISGPLVSRAIPTGNSGRSIWVGKRSQWSFHRKFLIDNIIFFFKKTYGQQQHGSCQ